MFDFVLKNDKGKENEELTNSMKKLQVEESSSGQAGSSFKKKPVIIIVVGMAGNVIKFNLILFCSL